jgi:hypothetical protein
MQHELKSEINEFESILYNDNTFLNLMKIDEFAEKFYYALCDNEIFSTKNNSFVIKYNAENSFKLVRNIKIFSSNETFNFLHLDMSKNGLIYSEIKDQLERLGYYFKHFEE